MSVTQPLRSNVGEVAAPASTSEQPITYGGRERFWMPKMWHGMSLAAWTKLLTQHRCRISPRHWPTAAIITSFSMHNSASRAVQELLYRRRLAETKLCGDPVFIIGHWRSGTTLLHELLALDERLTYPTTYECFSPNHFLLSEPFMCRWLGFLLPDKRLPDNVELAWNKPQEDEAALCGRGGGSPLLDLAFPNSPPKYDRYYDLDSLTAEELDRWQQVFQQFLREITFLRPRRIVLKSPQHTFRIPHLLQWFPDARFVHVVRNPFEVFPSTKHLWRTLQASQSLQQRDAPSLDEHVLRTYERMFDALERSRALIPSGRLCELRYEDLVSRPVEQVLRIYAEIELGDTQSVLEPLERYRAKMAEYQPNRYVLDDVQRATIRRRWGHIIERYGYSLS